MTVRLAITDFGGTGATVLLGPSLGTATTTLWGDIADRLADRYHVLGWDLPGHGASEPATGFTIDDLAAALLDAVDGPFGYAGVSLGGVVGQQLLLDAPDRITQATLISTGPRIGTAQSWSERAARVRSEGVGVLVADTPARWFAPGNRSMPAALALLDDLAATDADSYAAACEALARFDVRPRLAEISAPVLAVAGAQDPVTPPASLRHLAEGVQHGRLAVVANASHQVPVEAPDALVYLLLEPPVGADGPGVAALRANGMRVRREVLGDEHVDRASARADELTGDFQRFITTYAWGSVWTRPGLDRRSRSLVTITALVARGHHDELAMHLRAALNNGLTREQLKEALLQTAIYCGVPDANTAFRVAQEVFASLDAAEPSEGDT